MWYVIHRALTVTLTALLSLAAENVRRASAREFSMNVFLTKVPAISNGSDRTKLLWLHDVRFFSRTDISRDANTHITSHVSRKHKKQNAPLDVSRDTAGRCASCARCLARKTRARSYISPLHASSFPHARWRGMLLLESFWPPMKIKTVFAQIPMGIRTRNVLTRLQFVEIACLLLSGISWLLFTNCLYLINYNKQYIISNFLKIIWQNAK